MPLTATEVLRIQYHLGYPTVTQATALQMGVPRPVQTMFLVVNNATNNLLEGMVPQVRTLLQRMDDLETKLTQAEDRLAASSVGDIKLRSDECDMLEKRYVDWGYKLAELLGSPVYALSRRYLRWSGGINIPVRST